MVVFASAHFLSRHKKILGFLKEWDFHVAICKFIQIILYPHFHYTRATTNQLAHHKTREIKYCIMHIIYVS
jgi:hypothetical protein